jgi:DNA polymerase III alpha subunit
MLHLRTRTEYSFRKAFGSIPNVINCASEAIGIADAGTWGHVNFNKECIKQKKKPIFGVEIGVVEDATERARQPINYMAFLAKNNSGLTEIYQLVTKSTSKENFYYIPRISYYDLFEISENVIILTGTNPNVGLIPLTKKKHIYFEINPMTSKKSFLWAKEKRFQFVATSDNYYPKVTDRKAYEVRTNVYRWCTRKKNRFKR